MKLDPSLTYQAGIFLFQHVRNYQWRATVNGLPFAYLSESTVSRLIEESK
jgi:hypothetical protein